MKPSWTAGGPGGGGSPSLGQQQCLRESPSWQGGVLGPWALPGLPQVCGLCSASCSSAGSSRRTVCLRIPLGTQRRGEQGAPLPV